MVTHGHHTTLGRNLVTSNQTCTAGYPHELLHPQLSPLLLLLPSPLLPPHLLLLPLLLTGPVQPHRRELVQLHGVRGARHGGGGVLPRPAQALGEPTALSGCSSNGGRWMQQQQQQPLGGLPLSLRLFWYMYPCNTVVCVYCSTAGGWRHTYLLLRVGSIYHQGCT